MEFASKSIAVPQLLFVNTTVCREETNRSDAQVQEEPKVQKATDNDFSGRGSRLSCLPPHLEVVRKCDGVDHQSSYEQSGDIKHVIILDNVEESSLSMPVSDVLKYESDFTTPVEPFVPNSAFQNDVQILESDQRILTLMSSNVSLQSTEYNGSVLDYGIQQSVRVKDELEVEEIKPDVIFMGHGDTKEEEICPSILGQVNSTQGSIEKDTDVFGKRSDDNECNGMYVIPANDDLYITALVGNYHVKDFGNNVVRRDSFTSTSPHIINNSVRIMVSPNTDDSQLEIIKDVTDVTNYDKNIQIDKRRIKCLLCDKVFASTSGLRRHMPLHPERQSLSCFECGYTFVTKHNLNKHMTRYHARKIVPEPSEISAVNNEIYHHRRTGQTEQSTSFTGGKGDDLADFYDESKHGSDKNDCGHGNIRVGLPVTGLYSGSLCKDSSKLKSVNCDEARLNVSAVLRDSFDPSHAQQGIMKSGKVQVVKDNVESKGGGSLHPVSDLKKSKVNPRPCKCCICNKVFKNRSNLSQHLKIHTDENGCRCNGCNKRFNSKIGLERHMMITHIKIQPLKCSLCFKAFKSNMHLKSHMKSHKDALTNNCDFNESERLVENDVDLIDTITPVTGDGGEQDGDNRKGDGDGGEQVGDDGEQSVDDKDQHFSPFGEQFPREHSLQRLVPSGSIEDESAYKCPCGKEFRFNYDLVSHRLTGCHGLCQEDNPNPSEQGIHRKCSICGKTFSSRHNLRRHITSHCAEKPFQCSACTKSFKDVYELKRHMKLHTELDPNLSVRCNLQLISNSEHPKQLTEPHESDMISKSLNHNDAQQVQVWNDEIEMKDIASTSSEGYNSLNNLIKSRTCPELCECFMCSEALKDTVDNNLKLASNIYEQPRYSTTDRGDNNDDSGDESDHENNEKLESLSQTDSKRHETERRENNGRYVLCLFCGKSFSCAYTLRRHMIKHDGKPLGIRCLVCLVKFPCRQDLYIHMAVHGEKPFKCTKCDKSYSSRRDQLRHVMSHSKRYIKCLVCHSMFAYITKLKGHMCEHLGKKDFHCLMGAKTYKDVYQLFKDTGLGKSHTGGDPMLGVLNNLEQTSNCAQPKQMDGSSCDDNVGERDKSSNDGEREGSSSDDNVDERKERTCLDNCDLNRHIKCNTDYDPILTVIDVNDLKPINDSDSGQPEPVTSDRNGNDKNDKGELESNNWPLVLESVIQAYSNQRLRRMNRKSDILCSVCGKTFANRVNLNRHMVLHSGEKPFVCPTCGKSFRDVNTRNSHLKIHTKRAPNFVVSNKKKRINDNEQARHSKTDGSKNIANAIEGELGSNVRSVDLKSPSRVYPNQFVKKRKTGEKLRNHSSKNQKFDEQARHSTSDGNENIANVIEGEVGSNEGNGRSVDLMSPSQVDPNPSVTARKSGKKLNFTCELCGRVFLVRFNLKRHMAVHGARPFKCSKCDKSYGSDYDLKRHFLSNHSKSDNNNLKLYDKPKGEKQRFMCELCGRKFLVRSNLKRHMGVHGVRPFKCTICDKSYSVIYDLRKHLLKKSHLKKLNDNDEQPSDRNGNDKNDKGELESNNWSLVLESFIQAYSNPRLKQINRKSDILCSVCGKLFTKRASLNRHMILHSSEKPFVCPTCGKGYGVKYELKIHMRNHPESAPKVRGIRNYNDYDERDGSVNDDKDDERDGSVSDDNGDERDGSVNDDKDDERDGSVSDDKDDERDGSVSDDKDDERDGSVNDDKDDERDGSVNDDKDDERDGSVSDDNGDERDGSVNDDKDDERVGSVNDDKDDERVGSVSDDKDDERDGSVNDDKDDERDGSVNDDKDDERVGSVSDDNGDERDGSMNDDKDDESERVGSVSDDNDDERDGSMNDDNDHARSVNVILGSDETSVDLKSPSRVDPNQSVMRNGEELEFKCHLCGIHFNRRINLQRHMAAHGTGTRPFKCTKCDKSYGGEYDLKRHFLRNHLSNNQTFVDEQARHSTSDGNENIANVIEGEVGSNEGNGRSVDLMSPSQVDPNPSVTARKRSEKLKFTCELCWRKFARKSYLDCHMAVHGIRPFKCTKCDKSYGVIYNLKRHLNGHCNGDIKCLVCQKMFVSIPTLKRHMRLHLGEKSLRCLASITTYKDASKLIKDTELKGHTGNDPLPDGVMNDLQRNSNRKQPRQMITETSSCDDNGNEREASTNGDDEREGSTNGDNGNERERRNNNDDNGNEREGSTNGDDEREGSTNGDDEREGSTNGDDEREGSTNGDDEREASTNGDDEREGSTNTNGDDEREGSRNDDSSIDLKSHLQVGSDPEMICKICGKTYSRKTSMRQNLLRHMVTEHSSQRPFKCSTCGKSYMVKYDLNRHVKTHSHARPKCVCPICGITFVRKQGLDKHMVTKHSDERPFQCPICSKSFKIKPGLDKHMKCHTNK